MPIGPVELALAAGLLLVNAGLSLWLQLGLERKLLVAGARTVVQLLVMGFLLVPVFRWEQPGLVLVLVLAMVALAARESVRRVELRYDGIGVTAFVSLLLSCGLTALLAVAVILGVEPWWSARYLVPLTGMVLGNALTGISLGLDRALHTLHEQRERVEVILAFGGRPWEAARPVAAEAVRVGMTPILNSMSVVGLVTIPGMMTGQILGGTPPALAARYQILVMFLIAAATGGGVALSVLLALRLAFDAEGRLRPDWLRANP